jgi:hypothetical protein
MLEQEFEIGAGPMPQVDVINFLPQIILFIVTWFSLLSYFFFDISIKLKNFFKIYTCKKKIVYGTYISQFKNPL